MILEADVASRPVKWCMVQTDAAVSVVIGMCMSYFVQKDENFSSQK